MKMADVSNNTTTASPAPKPAPAPVAQLAPAPKKVSLGDFIADLQSSDRRHELVIAFARSLNATGPQYATKSDYLARFETFANQPVR